MTASQVARDGAKGTCGRCGSNRVIHGLESVRYGVHAVISYAVVLMGILLGLALGHAGEGLLLLAVGLVLAGVTYLFYSSRAFCQSCGSSTLLPVRPVAERATAGGPAQRPADPS